MGRLNESGGACADPILWPSVLAACHKFQTETKSMEANVISCFQFVPLQNYSVSLIYPCLPCVSTVAVRIKCQKTDSVFSWSPVKCKIKITQVDTLHSYGR